MRTIFGILTLVIVSGCEADIGSWCGEPDDVNPRVSQVPGEDNLSVDLSFDPCSQARCASTNGSRPYCTKTCASASECTGNAGETWVCEELIYFSRYGCVDWTVENDCVGSEQIIKYCQTSNATIRERDESYNREWPTAGVDDPGVDGGPGPSDGGT